MGGEGRSSPNAAVARVIGGVRNAAAPGAQPGLGQAATAGRSRSVNPRVRIHSISGACPLPAVWILVATLAALGAALSVSSHGPTSTPGLVLSAAAQGAPAGGRGPADAPASVAPAASTSPTAWQLSVWQITDKSVLLTSGVKPDAVYDQADLTINDFDPASYAWIAVSSGKQLVDPSGKTPAPPGQEVIWAPNTDDYIVVTVTGPSGSASAPIDRNTNMAAAEGTASVLYGTFPRVHVITGIDWSTKPPTSSSALWDESGPDALKAAFAGKGTYAFHLDFVNEFTDAAAHGPLWLLAGFPASATGPAPAAGGGAAVASPVAGGAAAPGATSPADTLASTLASDDTSVPTQQGGTLGGFGATGVLLLTVAAGVAVASPSLNGARPIGTEPVPDEPPPPAPKEPAAPTPVETRIAALQERIMALDAAHQRLANTALKVNATVNSANLDAGDAVEVAGDAAAALGAAATALGQPEASFPLGVGSAILSSISAASSQVGIREFSATMRMTLVDLAYLQGRTVADREALGEQLLDLQRQKATSGAGGVSTPPADLTAMSPEQLQAARAAAEGRVSAAYDHAIAAGDDYGRLVAERIDVARRVDAGRTILESGGEAAGLTTPGFTEPTLSAVTGGVSLQAGEKDFALGESLAEKAVGDAIAAENVSAAAQKAAWARMQAAQAAQGAEPVVEHASAVGSAVAALASAHAWSQGLSADASNAQAHSSVAELAYRQGELTARAEHAQARYAQLRAECDQAVAQRKAISAEIERRDIESGHVLWK